MHLRRKCIVGHEGPRSLRREGEGPWFPIFRARTPCPQGASTRQPQSVRTVQRARQLVLQLSLTEAAAMSFLTEFLKSVPRDRGTTCAKLSRDDLAVSAISKSHAFQYSCCSGFPCRDRSANANRDGGSEIRRATVDRRHDQVVLLCASECFPVAREHELTNQGGCRCVEFVMRNPEFGAKASVTEAAQTFW